MSEAIATKMSRPSPTGRISALGRLRTAGLAVLVIGVVPTTLAACSSAAASGSTTSKPSGAASSTAYFDCLKQHGVTLPSFTPGTSGSTRPSFVPGSGFTPGSGGGGFRSNPTFEKAATACKSLRPSGGFGGFGGFGGSGGFNSSAFAAYRNCLSLHGVTLPTRTPGTAASSTPPSTFDESSPTVKAAMQACAALRPSAPSSSTTTTG